MSSGLVLPPARLDARAWCRRVWYRTRDGGETPATVEAVDVMHPPPSFCVRLDGAASTRETEAPRLRAMPAADDPCAAAPPGAQGPCLQPCDTIHNNIQPYIFQP